MDILFQAIQHIIGGLCDLGAIPDPFQAYRCEDLSCPWAIAWMESNQIHYLLLIISKGLPQSQIENDNKEKAQAHNQSRAGHRSL